jgi:hypothetical protein
MTNAVFLSFLGRKQMESYGFFTLNRERFIGRNYGRVLRVSLMLCYDGIEDALD